MILSLRFPIFLVTLSLVIYSAPATATSLPTETPQISPSLYFEANLGQYDEAVEYIARENAYTLFLTPHSVILDLNNSAQTLTMSFINVSTEATIRGESRLEGVSNYIRGTTPDTWFTHIPHYSQVRYEAIYPGIDLVYYGNPSQMQYDFVVASGADPNLIAFQFDAAQPIELDTDGNLLIPLQEGVIRQSAPFAYQEIHGQRQQVVSRFILLGDNKVGFEVGAYNRTLPLIIDPVLVYSSYLGNGQGQSGDKIAVDNAGNIYVGGLWVDPNPMFDMDGFVEKLNPTGTAVLYLTVIGGSGEDFVADITVDGAGTIYATGSTRSLDFPILGGPLQPTIGGGLSDGFLVKLNTGGGITYGTYLGGSGSETGQAVTLDASNNTYVVGETQSVNFPGVGSSVIPQGGIPIQNALSGGSDGYMVRLNAAGTTLDYATYLGGGAADSAYDVAVNPAGNRVYVGGWTITTSTPFPGLPGSPIPQIGTPIQTVGSFGYDASIAIVNPLTGTLEYATYLGGNGNDYLYGLTIDANGDFYVTGHTQSVDFPGVGTSMIPQTGTPIQPIKQAIEDCFVAHVNPITATLVYSTYLGGDNLDNCHAIALDSADGSFHVTGITYSEDFPGTFNSLIPQLSVPIQAQKMPGFGPNPSRADILVASITSTGALEFSTYLGSNNYDYGVGITISNGNIFISGASIANDLPGLGTSPIPQLGTPVQPTMMSPDSSAFVMEIGRIYGVIEFSVPTSTVLESDVVAVEVTFTVFGSGVLSSPVTVNISYAGVALYSVDFTAPTTFQMTNAGGFTAAGGPYTATVMVPIDDLLVEGNEIATLTMSSPSANVRLGTNVAHTVTIIDNDSPAVIPSATPLVIAGENVQYAVFDPAISKIGFLQPGQIGVTGEEIEWVITVSNPTSVAGTNVVFTDTLRSELRVLQVETSKGTSNISGQTVTVNIGTLAAGESMQISIFTRVLRGVEVDNTACVRADNLNGERCATGLVVSRLPSTGEMPISTVAWGLGALLTMSAAWMLTRRFGRRRNVRAD